jgi:outer membrane lipase/esterase
MVLNVYAYARVVGPDGVVSSENATLVQQAASYSAQVWSGLAAAGVNFVPADIEGLLRYVSQHPATFGFTPANVLTANPACGTTSGLVCAPSDLVSPDAQQTHLWGDPAHLSTAGQTMEANYLYSLLTAPSEISMLTESAVQGGLARVSSIQGQIDLSGQQRGPTGVNAWITGGADTLALNNTSYYPNGSGPIFRGSVGGDYQIGDGPMRGLILGAAVTAGGANQNFAGGDRFNQTQQALSLYAAYRTGWAWGNAIASYGFLQSNTARNVALDQFIDHNTGNTSGRSLGLALRGGGDFQFGTVTTGPVAGVILQQVRLNGFTESGTTGVTALSFGGQTQGSAVTQLGWRGAMDLGKWRPFAEVAWNHEWASANRWITTSLTSIAAPSYVMPAAAIAKNWASAMLGASYRLTPQVALLGSLSAAVFNPQLASYGGDVGINIAF